MTKNDLINKIHSAKFDLEYLIKQIEFRLEFNDCDSVEKKYKDDEHSFAKKAGTYEAFTKMANVDMSIWLKNIKKTLIELENGK